jgi:hypothetical protein
MGKLSLSRAWEETKAIVERDGRLLGSVALALVFLPQILLAVVGFPLGAQASLASRIVYILVMLVGITAQISLNRLAIGPSVTVGGAIRRGFQRLLPLLAAFVMLAVALVLLLMLVTVILVVTGLMVLPAPGQEPPASLLLIMAILLAVSFAVLQLSIPISAVEQGGPIRLFTRSWHLARGNYLRLLAFVLLVFVGIVIVALAAEYAFGAIVVALFGAPNPWSLSALILGILAGLIQVAFTIVSAVMLARIYVQLAGGAEAQASVPSSGI